MIPLFKVAMSLPDALDGVAGALGSGQLEHGPRAEEFERAIAARLGNPFVTAVNSATSGLQLALSLVHRPGDGRRADRDAEVLCTPLTFEATNWPVLAEGLRLRWVDVDPATLNMDLDDLARKITPATRAIVLVHWAGYPVDLDRLRAVVDAGEAEHGVRCVVIEDCAQAWGATFRGRPLGTHGNISVYSFGAIKLLTCGSGGVVAFPDGEAHRRAKSRRYFGINRHSERRLGEYDVADWGYRFHLNELCAAVGLANLAAVDDLLERHRSNAAHLDKELADVPGLEQVARPDAADPSFWVYPVKVDDRPGFLRRLAEAGIGTSLIARRNDAHSCVADAGVPLPGLDAVHDRVVHIPVGWWLSDEDRAHISTTIRAGW
jgi:dTDP-4-amino-4,6-dideoxygalactose transaminase